ncbi:hypothetical protein MIR68_006980 [Amoeboaphelidium protococcarum]|nr:hypothetical protein MIR68_006980 [Amoeboaphelidium protococcarum]KAI3654845.1 hypothetical protein MP228_000225 [Amoeboaphelidium protococcarum]
MPQMQISNEEMDRLQVPVEYRDYCAHHFVQWSKCMRSNVLQRAKCHHELHEWEGCQYQQYKRAMKERDQKTN